MPYCHSGRNFNPNLSVSLFSITFHRESGKSCLVMSKLKKHRLSLSKIP